VKRGAAIVNTSSVNSDKGNAKLIGYSATKGAISNFTASLAQTIAEKGIRVNCVAPGPIWTPLIPSTFPPEKIKEFGKNVPMKRPGQPKEVAPVYVFLASDDASYVTGALYPVTGGTPML
jgi:NAD(P)-dependent dehydrogenase (short-subunit alcohol dehydrogenase family)